jgi:transcriptional regulator
MMAAIVGIEIPIARLEGKWKISQNRSESDQSRIAAGLSASGAAPALAALMSALLPDPVPPPRSLTSG